MNIVFYRYTNSGNLARIPYRRWHEPTVALLRPQQHIILDERSYNIEEVLVTGESDLRNGVGTIYDRDGEPAGGEIVWVRLSPFLKDAATADLVAKLKAALL